MFETMYKNHGMGLAAVQVGYAIRLFVMSSPKESAVSYTHLTLPTKA